MIRPNFEKWNQSAEDMRRLPIEAAHARRRERSQALYMIGSQQKNASQWAKEIKRQKQTVLGGSKTETTGQPHHFVGQL